MTVTFNDIAGYKQEKEEIMQIVEMFNNFKAFAEKGINLPKGLILYGRPGVGKTMFVKAIAHELQRNFYVATSDTQSTTENLKELKKAFDSAKQNTPSIVFIDELDKIIPRERGISSYLSDQTLGVLNYLLQALDGLNSTGDVMVIATSNRIKYMNEALLRSGRFDKHIHLSEPDELSRDAIIKHYLDKIDFDKDVNLEQVTLSCEGLTGADIATVINQTFINAVSKNKTKVTTNDILEQIYITEGKSVIKDLSVEENKIITVHELGHFVVAYHLGREVKDLSIGKMVNSMGRVRIKALSNLVTKEDILDEITILLGGKAAEEVILGKSYIGSRSDIEHAYRILKNALAQGDFGFEYLNFDERIIDETSEHVRDEISNKLNYCYEKSKKIIEFSKIDIEMLIPKVMSSKIVSHQQLIHEMKPCKQLLDKLNQGGNSY